MILMACADLGILVRGFQHFYGGGGGGGVDSKFNPGGVVQLLSRIETYRTHDFLGGIKAPCRLLDPRMHGDII